MRQCVCFRVTTGNCNAEMMVLFGLLPVEFVGRCVDYTMLAIQCWLYNVTMALSPRLL